MVVVVVVVVGVQFCGSRVNNLLCSGHLEWVSIDTCSLWADCREDLIKCKEPNKPPRSNNFHIHSFYCRRVKAAVWLLLLWCRLWALWLCLLSCPRCLVKINRSFLFMLFNCLAMRLSLSETRRSNIEMFVISGLLFCQRGKIIECRAAEKGTDITGRKLQQNETKRNGKCSLIVLVCVLVCVISFWKCLCELL